MESQRCPGVLRSEVTPLPITLCVRAVLAAGRGSQAVGQWPGAAHRGQLLPFLQFLTETGRRVQSAWRGSIYYEHIRKTHNRSPPPPLAGSLRVGKQKMLS